MQRHVTPAILRQIKDLAAKRVDTLAIARHVGLSNSTVHKARQGHYDRVEPPELRRGNAPKRPSKVTWCQRCRCHCEGSCKVCELRRGKKREPLRPRPPIPAGITDPRTLSKLNLPLSQVGLPVRTINRLEQRNILSVNDLLHCTRDELLKIPHVGEKALEEILAALARLGFTRRHRPEPHLA